MLDFHRMGVPTIDYGNKTIAAFQDVIDGDPSPQILDRAYAFIANTTSNGALVRHPATSVKPTMFSSRS